MVGKFLIVCLAITCVLAEKPGPPPSAPVYYRPYPPPPTPTTAPPPPTTTPPPPPPPPPPAYKPYGYAVLDDESGVDIAADELAENGAIAGSYKVVLPDGRIKTVTYTVEGDSGFVADVQFETTPAPVDDAASAPAPYPKYYPYPA
ncbi:cuticle protein 7-like [Lepeophtheirus salmonis]|uniref:cuticle protein 7-like n=1 Tax=Lepeophtheirus salmonis TaxID=72036 RepID=UPI001AE4F9B7|nr:cuticle protein 19.8-like [Lepeophtheirus salmonis]